MTASEARAVMKKTATLKGLKPLFDDIRRVVEAEQRSCLVVPKTKLSHDEIAFLTSKEYGYRVESEAKDYPTDRETANYIIHW